MEDQLGVNEIVKILGQFLPERKEGLGKKAGIVKDSHMSPQ